MTSQVKPGTQPCDLLEFASEICPPRAAAARDPWKILIVDDEEAIHTVTRLVLRDFAFANRGLVFLGANSGAEARALLHAHPDTALILLDVVMEEDDSGLRLVRHIREELRNRFVRIVLRTGQPGQAPEREVVANYDINDYKAKTELTAQKLFTTVTAALRAYRDLRELERGRRGLARIVDASAALLQAPPPAALAAMVLERFAAILAPELPGLDGNTAGFVSSSADRSGRLLAARGHFAGRTGCCLADVLSPGDLAWARRVGAGRQATAFRASRFAGCLPLAGGTIGLVYLEDPRGFAAIDRELIRVFVSQLAVSLENLRLNREIVETQKEVILTLGGVVETRSKETAGHVLRVGECAALLARQVGLPDDEIELLRLASPMHDIGKVGVPDAILQKPSSLDCEETAIMQQHTWIGHEILRKSHRRILQSAATVALQHHEWWNGGGYPQGLRRTEIHPFGRITGIVDVFDALSHRRIYKPARSAEDVHAIMLADRGRQFDPTILDAFLGGWDTFQAVQDAYPD